MSPPLLIIRELLAIYRMFDYSQIIAANRNLFVRDIRFSEYFQLFVSTSFNNFECEFTNRDKK